MQELGFTLAHGIAYCQAAVDAGLSPDEFGERLSFFFNAHNHFFQEVAKFRAARTLWARIMRERFGATNPKAQALRFHAQTGGSTLTAQQPENNIVRVAIQALSAVCGGAQSIHTNGYDEALALPTERAARIALRTQQVLANEAGGTDTADPLGGAYFLESLTRELEERAWALIERVDELGGAVAAIEQGFTQHEIEDAAYELRAAGSRAATMCSSASTASSRRTGGEEIELHRLDPEAERRQVERTAAGARRPRCGGCGGGACAGARRGAGSREPAPADARGARGALHGRRDLQRPARRVRHVRRPPGAVTLEDDVVRLRPFEEGDVPAIAAACQDPEIPRWTAVPVAVHGGRRSRLARVGPGGELRRRGQGERRAARLDRRALFRRRNRARSATGCEREARGRGVATRALGLVARWALVEKGLGRFQLRADVANEASQRVAEKAGFVREGVLRSSLVHKGERRDVIMYSLVREDL